MELAREKLQQAYQIVKETELDAWMMLDRESGTRGTTDPSLTLLLPTTIVGLTVFLVTAQEQFFAVAANYDADQLRGTNLFDRVIPYDTDLQRPLLDLLEELHPQRIGLNYSVEDFAADGLTWGLKLKLDHLLWESAFMERLVSGERVATALRGRKTPEEVRRIRRAAEITLDIFDGVSQMLQPGLSEREVQEFVHRQCAERGVLTAWESEYCPGITAGPHSISGHVAPSPDVHIEAGTLFSMDFGVKVEGYAADLQRTWYIPSREAPTPPEELETIGRVLRQTVLEAKAAMHPGVPGHEIDAVARDHLRQAGYLEYMHALGHQVGRSAHDGGVLLGPGDWPRYAVKSAGLLEAGQVFTLEPGLETPYGRYGTEEMVQVTPGGAEWLVPPQESLWIAGESNI